MLTKNGKHSINEVGKMGLSWEKEEYIIEKCIRIPKVYGTTNKILNKNRLYLKYNNSKMFDANNR